VVVNMTHRAFFWVTAPLVVLAVGAGVGLVSSAPAQAAVPCVPNGVVISDTPQFNCQNVYGARVYAQPAIGTYIDHLYTTTSWFECRTEGGPNGETSPHPTRWLLTKGDGGKLGYVRDTDVYSETNPLYPC
jgi:hypothetical protein